MDTNSSSRSLWLRLTVAVYLPTLLLALGRGMVLPIRPLFVDSFGVSYGVVGVALASQGVGSLLGDIPAGLVVGRLGMRRTMSLGLVVLGLSLLGYGLAPSIPVLMAFGLFSGLGTALWSLGRHAYLATGVDTSHRGRAIAGFGGINRLGLFLGPFAGGFLAQATNLRIPFLVFAGLALAAAWFPVAFLPPAAPTARTRRPAQEWRHLLHTLRRHGRILLVAGSGQLFAQGIRAARRVVIPLYAADVVGLDVAQVGTVVGIAAALDVSMFLPAGYIMDRFGRKFAYVPSFTLQALGMALIPFTHTFWSLAGVAALIGFGNGLGSGTMMTLGADLAPKDEPGPFLGLWRLIGDGGSILAPVLVGSVAQVLGLALAPFFAAGLGVLAVLLLGWAAPETLVRPRRMPANPP